MQATQQYLARQERQSTMIKLQKSWHPTPLSLTQKDVTTQDYGNFNWTKKIKETNGNLPTDKAINVIFDLPSARQTFLWYHAAAGFPVKESFIKAVRNGNYATWPKLTVTLINKYMPDSDKTEKGHLKGQR